MHRIGTFRHPRFGTGSRISVKRQDMLTVIQEEVVLQRVGATRVGNCRSIRQCVALLECACGVLKESAAQNACSDPPLFLFQELYV